MLKKIMIITCIGISFHIHAMEISICRLAKLPIDIQNLIALFVMNDYETDEEFIARTSVKKKEVLINRYDHFVLKIDDIAPKEWGKIKYRDKKIERIETCDRSKILLMQALGATSYNNYCNGFVGLTVVDKEKNAMMYHITEDINEAFSCFALSPSGNIMVRAMCKKHDYGEDQFFIGSSYKANLKIRNFKTNEIVILEPNHIFKNINTLEFNKQGACFIVRGGKNVMNEHDVSCYKIFYLKDLEIDISTEKTAPIEKPLQHYFMKKGVCKSITSGS